MAKILVSKLLAHFSRMLSEHWSYKGNASETGAVDCSGAFVWAYKQEGHSIYHGSNRIARVEVVKLLPIQGATIVPGMVAFKSRKPDDPKYDLPSSYRVGGYNYNGDLNDYYHIGLVSEDVSRVLNAQEPSTGFVSSPISKGWTHVALLSQVDYGDSIPASSGQTSSGQVDKQPEVTSSSTAVTVALSGSTVNLRKSASKSAALVDRIPLGQTVTLRGPESGGWYPVRWGKKEGYIIAEYLKVDAVQPTVPEEGSNTPAPEPEGESYSSYAAIFYDLSYEQAVALQADYPMYKSRIEGRNG